METLYVEFTTTYWLELLSFPCEIPLQYTLVITQRLKTSFRYLVPFVLISTTLHITFNYLHDLLN
jgi:hypothetical protein